jgi:hypothetical protein
MSVKIASAMAVIISDSELRMERNIGGLFGDVERKRPIEYFIVVYPT